jgi:putative FmdB family regulatory protein
MPTYEYRCQHCGTTFERRERIAEHEAAKPQCPQCGSDRVAPVVSAFYAKTSKKS